MKYPDNFVNRILQGDCITVMKTMPDNSVDSIVTDSPYGLGFMNKKWDVFDKSQFGQKGLEGKNDLKVKKNFDILPRYNHSGLYDFVLQWASECLRILKPGGHLLSFGGSRTYHRMACAIEDAGFEIRDMIVWVYGCLSEDTEILTINGWEYYHKNIDNNPVLCYDINKDTFEFHKPIRSFYYENKYPAYRIQSDNTDQIVSRNHRVLVERGGKLIFQRAEELQSKENIPFLESLPDLSEAISDYNERTGSKEQGLPKLYQGENGKMEYRQKTEKDNVQNVWKNVLSNKPEQKQSKSVLFKTLFRQGKELAKTLFSQWKRQIKTWNGAKGRQKSRLEGWSNLFQKTRELFTNKICEMSKRIFGYGSERWLCYGTPITYSTKNRASSFTNRDDSPYQSQSARQQNRKSHDVSEQQRTQVIRRTKATVIPIKYEGNVWCVEVPTGAFVARRNGKIFITGNSGFPKSLNIGKAVDKLQGNERTVVGVGNSPWGATDINGQNWGMKQNNIETKGTSEWEGWGTALKPAIEPITVARKPLSEKTVAENVLKWGTGGINIDGCRVELKGDKKISGGCTGNKSGRVGYFQTDINPQIKEDNSVGRFPANLILSCICDEVIEGKHTNPECPCYMLDRQSGNRKGWASQKHNNFNPYGGNALLKSKTAREGFYEGFNDIGGASRFFYCAKASTAERNRGCEDFFWLNGKRISEELYRKLEKENEEHKEDKNWKRHNIQQGNIHPTIKSLSLMEYLVKLVTPSGGLVLDPFCGSGSTLIAAKLEGFRFIGIEKETDYVKISVARLKAWQKENTLF